MTNLFLRQYKSRFYSQRGGATLILATIMLVTITLIVLFGAGYVAMQQKITSNQYRYSQAFEAAEAGLEFAIPYLQKNSATILVNSGNGFMTPYSDTYTNNVSLANNSTYTITYSNPVSANFQLILISVTGTSDDGTSTRKIQQLVKFGSALKNLPVNTMTSTGTVSLSGSSNITNLQSSTSIMSGSTISLSGSSSTTTASGGSSPGNIRSDIQPNTSSLQSMSPADLFASYMGTSMASMKSNASQYYSNSSSTNYNSQLNGASGGVIWIDQTGGTANINSSTTVGTAANPVLLIVNGNFVIEGNAKINGMLFVIGTLTHAVGNAQITGAVAVTGNSSISGGAQFIHSTTVLTALQNLSTLSYYAKIPGSWKDF
jgi:Tfp pilus assembly protein PilX